MQRGRVYSFSVVEGRNLSEELSGELSRVFSSSYGKWSADAPAPFRPGERIRMSPDKYRKWYGTDDFRFALCRANGILVGHAVYVERETSRGRVALVVQLVVEEKHRHKGIAKSLLHSIFGFSDYYAWSIITSSPCTVEALESATFRRGRPERIARDADFLKAEVFSKVPFLTNAEWTVSDCVSYVNSRFFTDRTSIPRGESNVAGRYGELPSGCEWLSVTFRDQDLDYLESFSSLIDCSSKIVADAYRRMPQHRQNWAKYAASEVESLLKWLPQLPKDAAVCDYGSGSGRHVKVLKALGFTNVEGIDFALSEEGAKAGVREADCRTWSNKVKYRLITCLYDVIGSFANDDDNRQIIRNIANNLSDDGYAVLTVANSEFFDKKGIAIVDSNRRPEFVRAVFRMKPSNAMATDGEFFQKESLWDKIRGLFYHKEQFGGGVGFLPAEYLVVDRRFTVDEISRMVEESGLTILLRRFVRAGFSKEFDRGTGKEILIVARKTH